MSAPTTTNPEVPPDLLLESGDAHLHIGGLVRKDGWQVLNAVQGDHVDHLGDLRDLSRFPDASFDMVYASHVFEHLGYKADLAHALEEVVRILRPAGRFFVSVPDLATLTRLFHHPQADDRLRFHLMRMIFGGQQDEHDFHKVGLWDAYLVEQLFQAGFDRAYRVPRFGLFEDTSNLQVGDVLISLNMVAVK